jgi:hypothetical protein
LHFSLEGSVIGDLTIEEGSSVVISGILEGNLYNNGGILEVTGIIKGTQQ